jgi:flagellar hook-associated protein 2
LTITKPGKTKIMSNFSFSSVGSGIDFGTIRDAILTQRGRPIAQMQGKANKYNNRIESLKQLNAALAALTTASEALTNRQLGTGRNAVTGDATVVTASATAEANLGNFDLNVTRIATSLTQTSRAYTSKTEPVLAGAATSATFELRKGGAASGVAITVDSTNNTLEGLRDAINKAADAGVTASIVDVTGDGTQQKIVLSSKETGASGRVELVETTATGTGADLNLSSINPPDGDFTKLDASFSINGLTLTRSKNEVTNAVSGISFTLKKAGTAAISITQSSDTENKLRGFINAYNAVQEFVSNQYKKDSKSRPTGVLAGDATLRNVQQQLRSVVGAISGDNGGSLNALSQIGVTVSNDGSLTIDSTVFNDRLKTDSESVRALLFGKTESEKGLFQAIHSASKGLSDSVTGSVQTAISGYETSIKNLNEIIASRTENLSRLRDSLTKQFSVADSAIGQLNGQGTALTSIIKSLEPRNN